MAKKAKTNKKTQANTKESELLSPETIDLLYQALETEMGGVQVYTTALRCVQNDDLKE